jgi:hypothetical protein
MAETTVATKQSTLADRWPTALAIACAAGAIAAIALLDRDDVDFGPVVVLMAGIYLMAFALGRRWTAWVAFAVLSTVMGVLNGLDNAGVLPFEPAVGISLAVVLVWVWTVVRRRYADGGTFSVQTAGMVVFGGATLLCLALAPRWGELVAGLGFVAHGAWDAYHYRHNKVVSRSYAEFCGVIDLTVGPALIIASLL